MIRRLTIRMLAFALLAFCCLQARTQSNARYYRISGKVLDTTGAALSLATIRMVAGADTMTVLSREDGDFSFTRATRRFQLTVTMQGYVSFTHSYVVPEGGAAMKLGPIELRINYSDLDPVIVARVQPVLISGDTISYSGAAFPVRDGSEVEDILRRLPGVEVDIDGNVLVQGKPVSKVLINGKEFFGGDILLAIQNLPADIVAKLQIIDDYGDKARLTGIRTGAASKVLNIVTKVDKQNGEFGQVGGSIGSAGKYGAAGFGNAFNGNRQIAGNAKAGDYSPVGKDFTSVEGFSYADQWDSKTGGSLNIARSTQAPQSGSQSTTTGYYPGEQLQGRTENSSNNYNAENSVDSRVTFKPDANSTFRLTVLGSLNQSNSQSSSFTTTLQQDSGINKSTIDSLVTTTKNFQRSVGSNLYFERVSPTSRRRFSIGVNLAYNEANQSGTQQSNAMVVSDGDSINASFHYLTENTGHSLGISGNMNYFVPVGPRGFLEMGYWASSTRSFNGAVTKQPDSSGIGVEIIDSLSENAVLRNLIQAIHAGYTGKFGRVDLSATVEGELVRQRGTLDSKGDFLSYHDVFITPNLSTAWNIASGQRLTLNFNSRPVLPTLQQLSPFINITNPQYPITGNPDLKSAYTSNLSIQYEGLDLRPTKFWGYGGTVALTETQDAIVQSLTTPHDSSQVIQFISWTNTGTAYALIGDFHVNLPEMLKKRLKVNYIVSVSSQRTTTILDRVLYPTASSSWSQTLHLQFIVPNTIESELSGNYGQTYIKYSAGASLPPLLPYLSIVLRNKYFFFRQWIMDCQVNQTYTSVGSRLETAPTMLSASLQREFLPHNHALLSISGFNLLNNSAGVSQSMTTTTVIQNRPNLIGRYFLLSLLIKLQRFK